MLLRIVEAGEPRALRLIGEVDISNASELEAAIEREIQEPGSDLTIDLAELTFIDSSGIRVLLRAIELLGDAGSLVLLEPTDSVATLLSLVGLDSREPSVVIRRHVGGEGS